MSGKLMEETEDLKLENQNSNHVQASESESILSYQNGSSSITKTEDLGAEETPCDGLLEEKRINISQNSPQTVNNQCLELIRKKLISELSSGVFRSDLENKIIKMDPMEISKERLSVIQKILVQISHLSDSEKLLLYLKLPSSTNNQGDPLRQPLNPLGNRQEIQQTIVWIKTHLEEDKEISLPKQDVYDQYLKYCANISMKPLSTADFGKVMKQVYPGVRPRRLGTRGNSRYCYSGMRNIFKLPTPSLPQLVHENKATDSVSRNDSGCVVAENEKSKKYEKTKRKLKTSTCRNFKIPSTTRLPRTNPKDSSLKYSKRTKVENSTKENEITEGPVIKQDLTNNLKTGGYEENCSQPFNEFDNINCQLVNDFGICFDNVEAVNPNNIMNGKVDLDLLNKINFQNGGLNVKRSNETTDKSNEVNLSEKIESTETQRKISPISIISLGAIKTVIPNIDIKGRKTMEVKNFSGRRYDMKVQKLKVRRSGSLPQSQTGFKKTYVPIQPKPVNNPNLTVHFEIGINNEKNGASSCQEADSLEPEEEIIKYFNNLEENKLLGVVEGSVMNNLVQMRNNSQNNMLKSSNSEGVRSQSCLENHSRACKPVESAVEFELPQRSQSSVEFSAEQAVTFRKQGNRDNISHLRLLLEKADNMEKLNLGEKKSQKTVFINGRCEKIPGSPSTKYFSFTPISPGPGSPLKTPKTSPFLNLQNTKTIPNNHFLPPNDGNLNSFNIVRTGVLSGGHKIEKNLIQEGKYPKPMLSCRPRSNSSTNFYCTKTKRNLTKVLSCDQVLAKEANFSQNRLENLPMNTSFPFPSLSGEIQELLGNQSKLQDMQSSTLRSQSVPLNRMVSEGSWFSDNFHEYLNESRDQLVSSDFNFVPDSDGKTLEPFIANDAIPDLNLEVFARDNQDISDQIFAGNFESGSNNNTFNDTNSLNVFSDKINDNNVFQSSFSSENIKSYLETLEGPVDKEDSLSKDKSRNDKFFGSSLYDDSNDNAKDPVITSFKPVVMGEFSSCPNSPALGFFTTKESVDNQLIEFLGLD